MKLKPYQEAGARWLSSHKSPYLLLADEQGLGKTAQAIVGADVVGAESVLVICPAVARVNWEREFEAFSDYQRPFKILASKDDYPVDAAAFACSYEYAAQFPERLRAGAPWDLVIVDETHFANNPNARRTQAVYGPDGVIHHTRRLWALSGTPFGNHWGELWVLLFTFGVTSLSYHGFLLRYCETIMGPRGFVPVRGKTERKEELRNMLARVTLRRKKEEVMKELPPIDFSDYVVEPGPVDLETEASLIQYIFPHNREKELHDLLARERMILEGVVEKSKRNADMVATLTGLSDSVSTLRRYTGLQKVQGVAELVKFELENDLYEKVVIFCIHQGVIERLRQALAKFHPLTLYGGTPPDKRQSHIDKFQENPKYRVFIANIKAAGTAITLTAAHNVIFAEQEWNPVHNAQAAMRCHRIGQQKPVTVRFVALANSIDQRVARVLKRKARDAAAIMG